MEHNNFSFSTKKNMNREYFSKSIRFLYLLLTCQFFTTVLLAQPERWQQRVKYTMDII